MATVDEIIAQQQAYASSAVQSADDFLALLEDLASTTYFVQSNAQPIPDPGFGFDISQTKADLLALFPDSIAVGAIDLGTRPEPIALDTVPAVPDITVPDFNVAPPTLNLPQAPSTALPAAPTAPSINTPTLPAAPTFSLPAPPTLGSLSFPNAPTLSIPDLTATLPADDLVAPTNTFAFAEQAYSDVLLDALKAKLLSDMINGGYGIEVTDEAALLDRARSREIMVAQAESDKIIADAAARGFPLPPGDMNVMLQRAQQGLQDRVSTLSRDILIKRHDAFVDNRKFIIQESRQLEALLINYYNDFMERSLNAAKAVLDASIRIFEAQVSRYNARLERYKADAVVFEAKVRAGVAQMEVYRTQMEGVRIQSDVQRTQVEVYNAQLRGVETLVAIYKTQTEVVQVQTQIEQLRIQAFRALVDAYGAQVQAKVGEFGMFEAQVRAEATRMQAYESQAQAYTAVIGGKRAQADIAIARVRAAIDVSGQKIDNYKALLATYQSDISAQSEVVRARTSVYSANVQGAVGKANALAEAHKLEITDHDLQFRRNVENAKIAIEDAKIFLQAALGSADARTRAAGYASDHYKTLAGSALNAVGAIATHSLVE